MAFVSNPGVAIAGILALFYPVSAGGEAASGQEGQARAELLLFGANWCAPCRAELADLPVLARAVAPHRLTLAWTDAAPRLADRPANVEVLGREEANSLLARHSAINAGLPFALARDAAGRTCGFARQRLDGPAAAALIAQCRSGRQEPKAAALH